jgi:hypothetical protein
MGRAAETTEGSMKQTFNARIVGHDIFTPDSKSPSFQLARVKLEVAPGSEQTEKLTKAALVVEIERLDEYPLRGYIRITLEDSQQELDLRGAKQKPSKGAPQLSMTPIKGGRKPRTERDDAPIH